jgi:PIN domain nuclease of toxin-antitoxin system
LTVLDSFAVIAFLRDEPARPQVATLLQRKDARLTAVGVAEVFDHLLRVVKVDEEQAALDLAEIGLLEAVPVEGGLGLAAGRLRARRYHRARSVLSLADCVAAEAARALSEPLATSDPHLLEVCHAERIQVIALPASDGSTWTAT